MAIPHSHPIPFESSTRRAQTTPHHHWLCTLYRSDPTHLCPDPTLRGRTRYIYQIPFAVDKNLIGTGPTESDDNTLVEWMESDRREGPRKQMNKNHRPQETIIQIQKIWIQCGQIVDSQVTLNKSKG